VNTSGNDEPAISPARAAARLWAGLRLVVLDVETTYDRVTGHRIVSVAAVTCRNGGLRARVQTLVNPGVAISDKTRRIHGLTDEHVAGEQSFADVAPLFLPLLTPVDGEQLVLVAHNVHFDIPVLRAELERAGLQIPDVAVLDTMGQLPALAGVRPSGGKGLLALLDALGLTNAAHHDAMADAVATAEAVVKLLELAAVAGHDDFDVLLAEVSQGVTTRTCTASGPGGQDRDEPPSVVLSEAHTAGHASLLAAAPDAATLRTWEADVRECAELRCPYLAARVEASDAPVAVRLAVLHAVLDRCLTGPDGPDVPAVATVLGALRALLTQLPALPGAAGGRRAALAWQRRYEPALTAAGRCGRTDRCPDCREGLPCPMDTWPDSLAVTALGDPVKAALGFLRPTGKEAGTGVFSTWHLAGNRRVADAALWLVAEHWRTTGQVVRAGDVGRLGWQAGSRDPRIADAYAGQLGAGGRTVDLQAALNVCGAALLLAGDSSHDGWSRLRARHNQLAGRLARLTVPLSGTYDADGNPIPARRHHPTNPQRTRPTRFLRQ